MVLTNANLRSESYSQMKSFLNGITGLDPRSRNKPNWIHASMPNVNSKGFDGYPFVVLKIGIDEDAPAFQTTTNKTFRVQMVVYSLEPTEVDAIVDKIRNAVDSDVLSSFSMRSFAQSNIDFDMDINGKKVIFVTIGMILKVRI